MMMPNIRLLMLLTFSSLLLNGCVSTQPRPTEELLPDIQARSINKYDKVLSIHRVKGGEKTEQSVWTVNAPKIDNEKFSNLIRGTIHKSGLFKDTIQGGNGNYILNAEIIFQDIVFPGTRNTLMFLVHYEIINRENGDIIWKKNIYTQAEMSTDDVFVGEVRIVRLHELGLTRHMNELVRVISSELEK